MSVTPPPGSPPGGLTAGHSAGRRVAAGIGAFLLGIGAAIAGVITLIVVLLATRVPDAYTEHTDFGDPPRSWGGAAAAVAWSGGMTLLASAAAVGAVALAVVAFDRHPGSRRLLAVTVVTPALLVMALLSIGLAVNAGDARLAVDCDEFRFDRAAFDSADQARWERQGFGLQDCESVLYGASPARVRELLGAPQREALDGQLWIYRDRFSVRFSGEGVERVRLRVED